MPGRCFLRRLYDLTKSVSHPNHRITLNKESRKDIQAWLIFADHFNGRNILMEQRWVTSESLEFFTDAAGSASSQAKGTNSTSFLTCVRNEVELVPLACEDAGSVGYDALFKTH